MYMTRFPILLIALFSLLVSPDAYAQEFPFRVGGSFSEVGRHIAVGPGGLVAVAGVYDGSFEIREGGKVFRFPLSEGGTEETDAYLAVYGPGNGLLYGFPLGAELGNSSDAISDVAISPNGDVIVTGIAQWNMDLDPGLGETVTGVYKFGSYVFIAAYRSDGTLRFGYGFPGLEGAAESGSEGASQVSVDEVGNIYFASTLTGAVDLDPGAGEAIIEGDYVGAVIASYTSSGKYRFGFEHSSLSPGRNRVRALDVRNGRIAVGSSMCGSVDVDPGPEVAEVSASECGWLVATYSTDGNFIQSFIVGDGIGGSFNGLALDDDGSVAIVGQFQGDFDFDPGDGELILSMENPSIFGSGVLGVYNPDMSVRYAHVLGPVDIASAALANGRLVLVGNFDREFDADPGEGKRVLSPLGSYDGITASFASDGSMEWFARTGGTNAVAYLRGLGVDEFGRSFVSGFFFGEVDVDPGEGVFTIVSDDSRSPYLYDALYLAYDAEGNMADGVVTRSTEAPRVDRALKVWPNPTAGEARVGLEGEARDVRLELVDGLGRVLALLHAGPVTGEIALPDLAPGVYAVRATGASSSMTARFVVVR